MLKLRYSFTVAALLGLSACAPSNGEESDTPSVPPGFELAAAKQSAAQSEQSQVIDLSVAELQTLRASGNIWLIDVRTDEEVADGMIEGASHIPLAEFSPSPELLEQANGREIVLYCRSGRRSAKASRALAAFLGKPVRHLAGGFIAWDEAGGATMMPQ
uniref:rhodanese-like domain-containing protein n=1 Tax=uncultured Erythrobacter sp. TaxID=263913 RepID=UPI0026291957|nr:rhodanese-like domain-containing protein [uncultured Erythrobacter sp.]